MFLKGCDDIRNIMETWNNDGYNELHNMACMLKHPNICDNIVNIKIPSQTTTIDFRTYIHLDGAYTEKEYLCSWYFSHLEDTILALKDLRSTHHYHTNKKAEQLFEKIYDKVDNNLLGFQLSDLANSLQIWSIDMGIIDPKTSMAHINYITSSSFCDSCGENHPGNNCLDEVQVIDL